MVAKKDKTGADYLCAYFSAIEEVAASSLKNELLRKLPEYMVPSFLIQLEGLPLNSNGKIDRKALPEPDGNQNSGIPYVAPKNETEKRLLEICKEILGIEKIGMMDNFLDCGGNSLKAAALIALIYKEFHAELQFGKVFRTKSILELAEYIDNTEKYASAAIKPVGEKDYYQLSFAQKRLFVLNQIEGDGINYNISMALRLSGNLDRTRLESAFNALIKRHSALRTSFHLKDGEPVQVVHENTDFNIDYIIAEENQISSMIKDFITPFKFSKAPLLRARLFKIGEESHVLVIDMHHIVSDGVSLEIISRELFALYNNGVLSDLKIQYKDFSEWQINLRQNNLQESGELNKKEQFWLDLFKGELPVLNMPADYPRPAIQSFEGSRLSYKQSADIIAGLRKFAAQTGATLYMVLTAAFNVMLHKYSGQEDIIIGSPAAGRLYPELSGLVGMFVNTLAVRNAPSPQKTFAGFLEEVKTNALKAYDNQEYQFEELVEKLKIPKDISRNPLFDVMFVLQNIEVMGMNVDGLSFAPLNFHNNVSKFDLTLEAIENGDELTFNFEYCTKLFKKETIQRLAGHYTNILAQVINNPQIKLSDIEMLSHAEKNQLLVEFNDTEAEYPRDKVIHKLIQEQVNRTPDNISVIAGNESFTYHELNSRANRLARVLRQKGVTRNSIVALITERSIEMSIAILAVLKAGGAYLPISP